MHPVFPKIAARYKQDVERMQRLGDNPTPLMVQRIMDSAMKWLAEIAAELPAHLDRTPYAIFNSESMGNRDKQVGIAEYLCLMRFGKSLRLLVSQAERGEKTATYQIIKLEKELADRRFGEHCPNFKREQDHYNLLKIGWGLGIRDLSAEELATVFDSFCPCGKSPDGHDGNSLAKRRREFQNMLRAEVQDRKLTHDTTHQAPCIPEGGKEK